MEVTPECLLPGTCKKNLPGAKITLIDGARCGFGASGRNGGWCMSQNFRAGVTVPELFEDVSAFLNAGVDIVRDLSINHEVDCDFTPASVINMCKARDQEDKLYKSWALAEQAKVSNRKLNEADIQSRFFTDELQHGVEYFDDSASIQPGKLARGLRNLLLKTDVEVFEGTKVAKANLGESLSVETEFGVINAGKVVMAGNGYSHSFGQFYNRYLPIISSVIATEPLSDKQLDAIGFKRGELLGLHGNDLNYFYANMTADNRIVIGGGHPIHFYGSKLHSGNYRVETNFIENYLTERLWPQLKGIKIAHRWGGNVSYTQDALFSLGRHPDNPNAFYALGYSGTGVSTSIAAGKALSELIAGQDTPLTRSGLIDRRAPYIPGEPFRHTGYKILS